MSAHIELFNIFALEDWFLWFFLSLENLTVVCVCSLVCEHVKKRFPKPPSPPALVYLFSLMIVFLILAWLHSSVEVDCTVLSLQMTSIWTVSIWHAFIYVGSRKAIFRWVSHFPSSFVVLTDQTFPWSFNALAAHTALKHVLDFWGRISREICHAYLDAQRHTACIDLFLGYWVAHNSTPMCLFSLSFEW